MFELSKSLKCFHETVLLISNSLEERVKYLQDLVATNKTSSDVYINEETSYSMRIIDNDNAEPTNIMNYMMLDDSELMCVNYYYYHILPKTTTMENGRCIILFNNINVSFDMFRHFKILNITHTNSSIKMFLCLNGAEYCIYDGLYCNSNKNIVLPSMINVIQHHMGRIDDYYIKLEVNELNKEWGVLNVCFGCVNTRNPDLRRCLAMKNK